VLWLGLCLCCRRILGRVFGVVLNSWAKANYFYVFFLKIVIVLFCGLCASFIFAGQL
jgi:hypothetical protein